MRQHSTKVMTVLFEYHGHYAKVWQGALPAKSVPRYKKKKAIQVMRQVGKGEPNCDIETASVKVVQRTSSLRQPFFSRNLPIVNYELVTIATAAPCMHPYAARGSAAVNALFTEERQPPAVKAVYCNFQRPNLLLSCKHFLICQQDNSCKEESGVRTCCLFDSGCVIRSLLPESAWWTRLPSPLPLF